MQPSKVESSWTAFKRGELCEQEALLCAHRDSEDIGKRRGGGDVSVKALASVTWRQHWQRDGGGNVSVAITTKRQILASSCEGTEYTDADDTKKKF